MNDLSGIGIFLFEAVLSIAKAFGIAWDWLIVPRSFIGVEFNFAAISGVFIIALIIGGIVSAIVP